ncbi:hypothetical protein LUZ60_006661 [Juncus effusus]|nr:hypothetical protein LUZ60_006661 [Juncus effusus]
MAFSLSSLGKCYCCSHKEINQNPNPHFHQKRLHFKTPLTINRRFALISILTFKTTILNPKPIKAEQQTNPPKNEENSSEGILGAIKTIFDPNEKTKSGKVLPKAYLKSAREVVKNLRESLEEDSDDIVQFRRKADSAKEAIKDYLSDWRGQKSVSAEESYIELEKVIRLLAEFYSKAGPSALLSNEIKSQILNELKTAEEFL